MPRGVPPRQAAVGLLAVFGDPGEQAFHPSPDGRHAGRQIGVARFRRRQLGLEGSILPAQGLT